METASAPSGQGRKSRVGSTLTQYNLITREILLSTSCVCFLRLEESGLRISFAPTSLGCKSEIYQ